MTVVLVSALVVVVVAAVAGVARIAMGPDDASRAVVADLLFFCAIAVFVLSSLLRGTTVLFDVALIATFTAILATVALARILTRGRR